MLSPPWRRSSSTGSCDSSRPKASSSSVAHERRRRERGRPPAAARSRTQRCSLCSSQVHESTVGGAGGPRRPGDRATEASAPLPLGSAGDVILTRTPGALYRSLCSLTGIHHDHVVRSRRRVRARVGGDRPLPSCRASASSHLLPLRQAVVLPSPTDGLTVLHVGPPHVRAIALEIMLDPHRDPIVRGLSRRLVSGRGGEEPRVLEER